MGRTIWEVLECYRGLWIAMDGEGLVVDTGAELGELRGRTPRARTFVFSCGEDQIAKSLPK